MKKKLKVGLIFLTMLVFIVTGGFVVYIYDYYRADVVAIEVLNNADDKHSEIAIEKLEQDAIAFVPENPKAAVIFYPGGKVEYTAYTPLMEKFAKQDVLCILVKMPCNLAVFDIQAAKRYRNMYPNIDKWYIGGHSLGGSMAASCVSEFVDEYTGLILLAAYSTVDLRDTNLQVISIYGSEDMVLNIDKYLEYKDNLPDTMHEMVIEGGCHAYFGNYGAQDGDGTPTITREEQLEKTVKCCVKHIQFN